MHSRTRAVLLPLLFILTAASPAELQQWREQAQRVTITRDDVAITDFSRVRVCGIGGARINVVYLEASDGQTHLELIEYVQPQAETPPRRALNEPGTAIVEMARASGLALLDPGELDDEAASTQGTGELILAAVEAGAQVVLVACGGSATTDGGRGAIEAIEDGGGLRGGLRGARIACLCDVRVPFERAAEVFGPQKGADPATVRRLTKRLNAYAAELPRDPRGTPMTGCAGGLSGGLWAQYGAALEPGAGFVLQALDFDERMRASRAVIVGEGRIDEQTLQGKIAGEIATRARQTGVPCFAIVGSNGLDAFGARMLDLQRVLEASDLGAISAAAASLVDVI